MRATPVQGDTTDDDEHSPCVSHNQHTPPIEQPPTLLT